MLSSGASMHSFQRDGSGSRGVRGGLARGLARARGERGGSPTWHEWMRHQRRDAYWKQGSVCEDTSAIECAVYAVGGWVDGYSDAILRLVGSARCALSAA